MAVARFSQLPYAKYYSSLIQNQRTVLYFENHSDYFFFLLAQARVSQLKSREPSRDSTNQGKFLTVLSVKLMPPRKRTCAAPRDPERLILMCERG